jgi:hypothetical protein
MGMGGVTCLLGGHVQQKRKFQGRRTITLFHVAGAAAVATRRACGCGWLHATPSDPTPE